MKKSILVVALAVGFAFTNLQAATTNETTTTVEVVTKKKASPLVLAISKGDIDGVKKLIELGADVNKKSNGMYPVHFAARYNKVEIMELLVKAGAKTNKRCDLGYTVKKHAQLSKATDVIRYLEKLA
ncbi:ankyrin repeat domain-containing protein [Patiriisocius hiemis]|uniref:Ankyrin repeat domain-containing protein n=1 Tax=Patiriisocius hiemis TaxID=3075604 RepID=A0ABU2YEB3_9FLAO|nr:ankyrin repeat domain-containing protein [Constantimarinum sp. W242]MDT0556534.1 ankyrin repeat domain-containing protein [Constantimarinum sp. W242]